MNWRLKVVILSRNINRRSIIFKEEHVLVKFFTYLTFLVPTALCWWVGILSSFDLNLDNSLNHNPLTDLAAAGATYFVSGFIMALLHSAIVSTHQLSRVAATGCLSLFITNAVLFTLWRLLLGIVPDEYRWPSLLAPAILAIALVAATAKWRVRNRVHITSYLHKATSAHSTQSRFRQ